MMRDNLISFSRDDECSGMARVSGNEEPRTENREPRITKAHFHSRFSVLGSRFFMSPTRAAPLRSVSLIVALITATTASAQTVEPWATYRGNLQRTGNTDGKPGPRDPKILWVLKSKDHYV